VSLTNQLHLAPRLKIQYCCTSPPSYLCMYICVCVYVCVCVCVDNANITVNNTSRTSRAVESDGTIIINLEYEKIINRTVFSFSKRCRYLYTETEKMLNSS
jgi:hypothetical protein